MYKFVLRPKYKSQPIDFKEFFKTKFAAENEDVDKRELFSRFRDAYIQSFNGKFRTSNNNTKSFSPKKEELYVNSFENLIYGFFNGGSTGIEQEIFDSTDAVSIEQPIGARKVVSLKHFGLLYLPYDLNYGIVMLQSYSSINSGIGGPFFEHLEEFLSNYEISIRKEVTVPNYVREHFLKNSVVLGIDVTKPKTSKERRQEFNPAFAKMEKLRVKLSFTGMNFSIGDFFSKVLRPGHKHPIYVDMTELGFNNPSEYTTTVHYKDVSTGKTATAKVTNNTHIFPTITLENSIKELGKEHPDLEKMLSYCKKQIEIIREDS
jgi:hypothetical protein